MENTKSTSPIRPRSPSLCHTHTHMKPVSGSLNQTCVHVCASPTVTSRDVIADPCVCQTVPIADGPVVSLVQTPALSALTAASSLAAADDPVREGARTLPPRGPVGPHAIHWETHESNSKLQSCLRGQFAHMGRPLSRNPHIGTDRRETTGLLHM